MKELEGKSKDGAFRVARNPSRWKEKRPVGWRGFPPQERQLYDKQTEKSHGHQTKKLSQKIF